MKAKYNVRGATLVELVCACTVVGVISTLSLPALGEIIASQRMKTTVSELRLMIKSARQLAVHNTTTVTLCPSADQITCSGQWRNPLILFADPNHNERVDAGEQIERRTTLEPGDADIKWRSLKSYLQFSREGFTMATSGSLRYCPQDSTKVNRYRKLVISRLGRVRISHPKSGITPQKLKQEFGC
ncbi:GspH/FimT family pseudopilin [Aestuariirhabdus sp. LZHN29]|uniref:GspH/FimT family pseudopilin n=1 Tax=Aestuariirhabdus sp. LZHN29 TaxID=3417462 RepID=UPI003CFA100B